MDEDSSPAEKKPLFRTTAKDRLASPEQLDKLIVVISPKGWVGLLFLIGLLIAVGAWMAFATIPVQITVKGVVKNPDGNYAAHSEVEGSVVAILVKKGDKIAKGTPLIQLENKSLSSQLASKTQEVQMLQQAIASNITANGSSQAKTNLLEAQSSLQKLKNQVISLKVTAPLAGVVDRLSVNQFDVITPKDPLVIIEEALKPGDQPQVYGFIPLEYRNRVLAGMDAKINIITFDPNSKKALNGKVVYVSQFATSEAERLDRFGHAKSLSYFASGDAPLLELQVAPEPSVRLVSGDFCTVQITLMRKKPWRYIFP